MAMFDNTYPDDVLCKCGRQMREMHCIACGSVGVEGKAKLRVIVIDNKTMQVKMFRCRRCGLLFNETERLLCEAPLTNAMSMRARRLLDKAQASVEHLSYEERKKLVFDQLLKDKKSSATPSIADEIDNPRKE